MDEQFGDGPPYFGFEVEGSTDTESGQGDVLQVVQPTDPVEQGDLYLHLECEGWVDPELVVRLWSTLARGRTGIRVSKGPKGKGWETFKFQVSAK